MQRYLYLKLFQTFNCFQFAVFCTFFSSLFHNFLPQTRNSTNFNSQIFDAQLGFFLSHHIFLVSSNFYYLIRDPKFCFTRNQQQVTNYRRKMKMKISCKEENFGTRKTIFWALVLSSVFLRSIKSFTLFLTHLLQYSKGIMMLSFSFNS